MRNLRANYKAISDLVLIIIDLMGLPVDVVPKSTPTISEMGGLAEVP
jgi:hypothetical protein